MIMSLQWEPWKEQTRKYFRDLDESLLPVDSAGGTSLLPQAYVIGNSPYYQIITQMAREHGLSVPRSFNSKYDEYLPQAKGNFLLVETHNGVPIVPVDVLEKYFPGASRGIQNPDGIIEIDQTTIVFLDFSKQLSKIDIDGNSKKQ